jgi:predicted phage tail protein
MVYYIQVPFKAGLLELLLYITLRVHTARQSVRVITLRVHTARQSVRVITLRVHTARQSVTLAWFTINKRVTN